MIIIQQSYAYIVDSSFSVLAAFPTVPPLLDRNFLCMYLCFLTFWLAKAWFCSDPHGFSICYLTKNKVTVHRFMVLFNIRTIGWYLSGGFKCMLSYHLAEIVTTKLHNVLGVSTTLLYINIPSRIQACCCSMVAVSWLIILLDMTARPFWFPSCP